MRRRSLLIGVTGALCLAACGEIKTPDGSLGGTRGAGGTTSGGGSTSGSSGACTNDETGGGTTYPGAVMGACVRMKAHCGELTCIDYRASSAYSEHENQAIAQGSCCSGNACSDGSNAWFQDNPCSEVILNLVGGCEYTPTFSQAQGYDEWFSSGGCFTCGTCMTSSDATGACLHGTALVAVNDCEAVMPMTSSTSTGTGGSTGGGGGSSSSSSSSSSGTAQTPTCTATLTGGPIDGAATFACTATVLSTGSGFEFDLAAASTGSDGGWSSNGANMFVQTSSASPVGNYAQGDGGLWQAEFTNPAGLDYGNSGQAAVEGSIDINVTGVDANHALAGTATVLVPFCPRPTTGCDGGLFTVQYEFTD